MALIFLKDLAIVCMCICRLSQPRLGRWLWAQHVVGIVLHPSFPSQAYKAEQVRCSVQSLLRREGICSASTTSQPLSCVSYSCK